MKLIWKKLTFISTIILSIPIIAINYKNKDSIINHKSKFINLDDQQMKNFNTNNNPKNNNLKYSKTNALLINTNNKENFINLALEKRVENKQITKAKLHKTNLNQMINFVNMVAKWKNKTGLQ